MPAIWLQAADAGGGHPARVAAQIERIRGCHAVRSARCQWNRRDYRSRSWRQYRGVWTAASSQHSPVGDAVETAREVARQRWDFRRDARGGVALSSLWSEGSSRRAALQESRAWAMNGDRIIRYSLAERIMHWIAALSYVYLLITGLAFYSPRLYWLTSLTGGGPTARAWHPLAGLLFLFSLVWMYR